MIEQPPNGNLAVVHTSLLVANLPGNLPHPASHDERWLNSRLTCWQRLIYYNFAAKRAYATKSFDAAIRARACTGNISNIAPFLSHQYPRTIMGQPPPKEGSSPDSLKKQKPIWTRNEIAQRILAGENIFIYRGSAVRVSPSWLALHPGGDLAILHFVGRDATDEIDAFHADETIKQISKFVVARIETGPESWNPLVPPYMTGWRWEQGNWVRGADAVETTSAGLRAEKSGYPHLEVNAPSQLLLVGKSSIGQEMKIEKPSMASLMPPASTLSQKAQTQHSAAYKELHKRIVEAGLYKTRYITGIGPDVLRYCLLILLSVWCYQRAWYIPSAVFLGLLWHQLTFFAHDLGHMGVTHNWTYDRIISIFCADFVGGLSIGWWVNVRFLSHFYLRTLSEHVPTFCRTIMFITVRLDVVFRRAY